MFGESISGSLNDTNGKAKNPTWSQNRRTLIQHMISNNNISYQ